MKKIFKIIGITTVGLALIGGGAFYWFIKKNSPAAEERLNFNSDRVVSAIDKQLSGINVEDVKSKKQYIEQKSVEEIQNNIANGNLTYEQLTAYYLLRIKEMDQSSNGNNAMSEINPKAIEEARNYDNSSENFSLKGIPVVLKENINTNDMPTSTGTIALKDFVPSTNAPVVDSLKSNGAIILGKTNLSELSYWLSVKTPSGYSAKKGQTLNPFGPLKISPMGSSSGSAVAMADDLATLSLGSETIGSIVAPSSVNSVVGFKPTRNAISGEGVIPITTTLDTLGPITKTVQDALATYNASTTNKIDVNLDKNYIKGKRIAIVKGMSSDNFNKDVKEKLTNMGAEVVEIKIDDSNIDSLHILLNDFERDFNKYLETYNAPIKSLQQLINFNKEDEQTRIRYGQSYLEQSLNYDKKSDDKVKESVNNAKTTLANALKDNNIDAIVTENNAGATLAAVAGAPEISVPFGIYDDSPVGATFFTAVGDDAKLVQLAYSFEQNTLLRKTPQNKY